MYIILSYATCVLLVAIASMALFGLCAAVVIVQEGLRNVGTTLSRFISLETPGPERRPVILDARFTLHLGGLLAPKGKP